ncbi:MAG: hypothetical protein NW241_05810 [Bacteroidia bacterium]|nr:hypothetical protein [Bacteroidia bacterium]
MRLLLCCLLLALCAALPAQDAILPLEIQFNGQTVAAVRAPIRNHSVSITLKSHALGSRTYTVTFETPERLRVQFRDSYATGMQVAENRSELNDKALFILTARDGSPAQPVPLQEAPVKGQENSITLAATSPYRGAQSIGNVQRVTRGPQDLRNVSEYTNIRFIIGDSKLSPQRSFHLQVTNEQRLSFTATGLNNDPIAIKAEAAPGGALIRLIQP